MFKTNKGIIQKIRQSRTFKGLSVSVLLTMFFETIQPTVSLALTEGPSQPEVQSFEPVTTTNMVDLFSGDFNYNIPLFNLPGPNGGYPVNLAYHAGASMDDEASWVGLGWNINVGSLVRNMRGLPDEFMSKPSSSDVTSADGGFDYVEVQSDIKESWTLGLNGGFSPEIFGANLAAGQTALGMSASVYYNNYSGAGISVGPTLSVGTSNGAYNFGLSLDTENGLGVSASLQLQGVHASQLMEHTIGLSFDGKLSIDYDLAEVGFKMSHDFTKVLYSTKNGAHGVGISFARNAFSPALSGNVDKYNLAIGFKTGISLFGVYGAGNLGIFYNTQDYSGADKTGRKRLVTGYAQSGTSNTEVNTNSHHYLRDFSRQNDGQITKSTMFLPNSQYNYDIYNSTGQGLSGYFRARRSDVGRSFDPYIYNSSTGLSASIDLSNLHLGTGLGINFGWDSQGPWDDLNALQYDFLNPETDGITENVYYQYHGEQTILHEDELDYMRGLNLPFVRLKTKDDDNLAGGKRRIDASATSSGPNNEYAIKRTPGERVVRNTMINNLRNKEVGEFGQYLGEFNIKYFTNQSQVFGTPASTLARKTRNSVNIENHPAGYKVLNQDGSNYVYGLPCYNNKEVENTYSVAIPSNPNNTEMIATQSTFDYKVGGTHKFISKTTKSPYAHSYLLSSVQGNDYIDITNNGPSDDDMGYWVKFNYLKYADNYKWRAPYANNHYSQGQVWTAEDDKASYQYGEKEVWYLGQIETKSHIAVFEMQARADTKEAAKEYTGSATSALSGMKLVKIHVYEKKAFLANPAGAVPSQTINFEYESGTKELCKSAPNASNGKLTLRSVYFTYNGSTRGSLSKYSFDYTSTAPPVDYDNPSYASNSYDSWGTYKPKAPKYEFHSRFPYVNQFNQDWSADTWEPNYGTAVENDATKTITQQTQDALASAWCLKKISLPSGGTINIQYESDDYGYVQHKTANQMFKVSKLGDHPDLSNDEIYNGDPGDNDFYDTGSFADEKRRRIYFKLEYPIPAATSIDVANKQVYDDYVVPIIKDESNQRNLFYKTKMRLTSGVYDYVSGYLPLEDIFDMGSGNYNFGVSSTVSNGFYTQGFVTVKAAKKKNGSFFDNYHPLALAGWTYLQTNAQMLLNSSSSSIGGSQLGSSPSVNDVISQVGAVASMLPTAASSFGAIRAYCKAKDLARYINLDYSCIRLASPDKKKFGGGHRVKEISMIDNWSSDTGGTEQNRTYGQRFEYTMNENGKTISSGVAQYEPQAGGDENALKYPIYYFDKQNLLTKNNLFAEAPMNESLYPGASVGYSKVTVKSINTAQQIKNAATGTAVGRTAGVTVSDFYTSRDFPTIVSYSVLSEENSTKDVFNLPIVIPLIGAIKRNYYHGTQAYMIELNDMHGKPKATETFELNGYVVNPNPITSSSYEYQYDVISYQGETVKKLNNYVSVIANDGKHTVNDANKRLMGVETDLFTDQRESKTFNMSAGLDLNVDIPFLPFLTLWPTLTNTKSMFRTYVTNKIVHRTGILKKTKSRDLQTVNESEIIAYDEKSGIPLLTKAKNEFGDDFYKYDIPSYYAYNRMGHAYRNINYNFTTNIQTGSPTGATVTPYLEFDATGHYDNLVRGDELLITDAPQAADKYKKVYFLGWKYTAGGTKAMLHSPFGNVTVGNGFKLKVIRSGNRNQFGNPVASYLTKGKFEQLIRTNPADPNTVNNVQVDPSDNQILTPQISGNLLSASASLFRDDWAPTIQTDLNNDFVTENPFLTGNSGIWRPYKSYTYAGPRKTSASIDNNTAADPQLYNDGVFENPVKMFTWELGNMEDYVSNWEWVNEITRYSPDAYELENVNRIGAYSSALFGYDNTLSIGVAGNAEYNEVGVADFETILGSGALGDFMRVMGQTNLNFDNNHAASTTGRITEQFNIKTATVDNNEIVINQSSNPGIPVSYFNNVYTNYMVGLSLTTRKNGLLSGLVPGNLGFYFNAIYSVKGSGVGSALRLQPFLRRTATEKIVADNSVFHGKIAFFIPRAHGGILSNAISYVTTKAHTGKKSMRMSANVIFEQPRLKMKNGKKYVYSMWVSQTNENVRTYEPSFIADDELVRIGKMVGVSFTALSTASVIKYGKIVEGWQKVDVEFTWDSATDVVPAIQVIPGLSVMYVDDVRISPKAGGVATYVYDPAKFWLSATLNVDNYATLYYYDEEGNMHLKKQETGKGIITVLESRGHVSK